MNVTEHLLGKVAEECVEIAQRALKAQAFGLYETQEGQSQDNAARLNHEFNDLLGVMEMLASHVKDPMIHSANRVLINAKKAKVEKYMAHARDCGTLAQSDIGESSNG